MDKGRRMVGMTVTWTFDLFIHDGRWLGCTGSSCVRVVMLDWTAGAVIHNNYSDAFPLALGCTWPYGVIGADSGWVVGVAFESGPAVFHHESPQLNPSAHLDTGRHLSGFHAIGKRGIGHIAIHWGDPAKSSSLGQYQTLNPRSPDPNNPSMERISR
jgi:hypothetical protein